MPVQNTVRHLKLLIVAIALLAIAFGAITVYSVFYHLGYPSTSSWWVFSPATGFGLFMAALQYVGGLLDKQQSEKKVETAEKQVREHPDKPQFAWDLARTKLESYLDRNLSQVRSIYWLTLFVMFCGFAIILWGLAEGLQDPQKLSMSVVSSASGILVSFIGGSFLLIYRSILAQSKDYVTVLERINAVGMAVQVIASIPDEQGDLKHKTTADLARQLLALYAKAPEAGKPPRE